MRILRITCPQCGSGDVVAGDQTTVCNECGETSRSASAPILERDVAELPLDELFRRCA